MRKTLHHSSFTNSIISTTPSQALPAISTEQGNNLKPVAKHINQRYLSTLIDNKLTTDLTGQLTEIMLYLQIHTFTQIISINKNI
jgi:hypothetical protein